MSRTYRFNPDRERTFHKPKRRAFLRCVSGNRPFETAQAAHLRIGEIQAKGDTRHDITKDIRNFRVYHCPLCSFFHITMKDFERKPLTLNV
jgi:hypothetical protein